MADPQLPRLMPAPNRVSIILWYGHSDAERRGIVYETTAFEIRTEYDSQVGARFVLDLIHPTMVDEKAFVRVEER